MRLIVAGAAVCCGLSLLTASDRVAAQESNQPAPTSDDDEKLRLAAERFLEVLEKNPRRGTALDRLYSHHVEAGTLDELVSRFEERTTKEPRDGAAWMIRGLIESQRGHDAAAVETFTQAEKVLIDNALASYYLGQSLVLVGRPDDAAAAFERGIARKPARADLLEMFQALGRVYQRGQKGEQALEVWGRLEKLFPDDLRVQEQIAATLVEEGEYAQALPRFEALARKVKDDYRAATFRVEAADIKVRLGQPKEALADFEQLLNRLNPDNWLYRDIRRRIDEVFLRTDDQAGLAAYYETWIAKNPEDLAAMTRLARILAGIGRAGEAQSWLDKALKLAPSRKDLRLALIEQYVAERQYQQAIAQYEILAKNDPNNPDALREWGRLILKDSSRPEAERKAAAAAVWRRLLEARPKDSLTATQVADLFRHSEMPEAALELYQRAVELSPEAPQYREYLGEFFHSLKRSDEALAAWREIAAEKNRTPQNIARLAEVLAGFGYLDEAIANILEACRLDAGEFKYPFKAADLLARREKYGDSLAQLVAADKLADGPEARENVLRQRIRILQLAEGLDREIDSLQKDVIGGAASAERWYLLARYLEAARRFAEADRAIGKALALDNSSILYRSAAARIEEFAGDLQGAADACRQLASIDRRNRSEHLTNVARLEVQLGRSDEALAAGRDLLAASPGNPETYEFFAQLCFQLGRVDDGLNALRRSVRLNPAEPRQMLTLAAALADQFRTDEAIELYWRAFDKSTELEAKLSVVQRLADLYLQTNHLDRLIERLERLRHEASSQREMSICLAQAHQSAGDYGTARQELERLLEQNSRDTQLLQQLASLTETEGDLALAVKYQRQLVAITPGKETQSRLAQLLARNGENEEAAAMMERLAGDEQDPGRLLSALDNLLAHDKRDAVLSIAERALRDQPHNWELLYRAGEVLARDRPAEAERRFRAILALGLSDDDKGEKIEPRAYAAVVQPAAVASPANSRSTVLPLVARLSAARLIRTAAGLDGFFGTGVAVTIISRSLGGSGTWAPADFGQARMAALAWLFKQAEKNGEQEQFVQEFRKPIDQPSPAARDLWDWLYLQQIRNETADVREVARRLAQTGDPIGQWLFLSYIPARGAAARVTSVLAGGGTSVRISAGLFAGGAPDQNDAAASQPLPADELDHILECYRALWKNRPELVIDAGAALINNVVRELQIAGRKEDADEIFNAVVAASARPQMRRLALHLAAARGDCAAALKIFELFAAEQLTGAGRSTTSATEASQVAASLAELMAQRAAERSYDDVLKIVKSYLVFAQHRHETSLPGRGPARRSTGRATNALARLRSGMNIRTWIGQAAQISQFDYPEEANDYYDAGAINVLREAFELYQHDDVLSDLIAHFESQAGAAPEAERIWWRMGLAYLRWWSEDQDEAVSEFARAVELAPNDAGLNFELAALYERRQDHGAALAVVDGITPLDHQMLQERETAALRLAVRTGQIERARQAAERLFGLRLDPETQLQLVAEMRGLGMNDQANTVLARARRQAGNRVETLMSLMRQYQAEQKTDLAVQVAHEILRRGGPSSSSRTTRVINTPSGTQRVAGNNSNRQVALMVLSQSGRLDELIARAEAQLAASPASVQLLQTLTEYYEAAGKRPKILETVERMAAVRPDDARLRFQVAQQLVQAGKINESIEHYTAAVKKEPALFGQYYPQIQQAFQRADKSNELLALLDEIDLGATGNSTAVMRLVQMMMMDQRGRVVAAGSTTVSADQSAALKLFRRAWDAYPSQRPMMMQYLQQRTDLANLPEIAEYAREAVMAGAAVSAGNPWGSTQQAISISNNGSVTTVTTSATQLVDMAKKQDRLTELRQEVTQALEKYPTWLGGKAILAIIELRSGHVPEGKQIIEELLADTQHPIPLYTAWTLGQELDLHGPTQELVQALYESAINQQPATLNVNFNSGPFRRLVEIYKREGDREKARALVLRSTQDNARSRSGTYPVGYLAYVKLNQAPQIGQQLVSLGFPFDAMQYYTDILEDQELPLAAQQYGGNTNEQMLRQVEQLLATTRSSITDEKNLAQTLGMLLEPRPAAARKPGAPVLGLMLQIYPAEMKKIRLTSPVDDVLRAAKGDHQQAAQARVAALVEKYADDLSVQIVAALAAIANGQPETMTAALAQLDKRIEDSPLEELPAGSRANSRQRAAAAPWLGLWLVAREDLKSPERRDVAVRLADRALAAARRQKDQRFALAILREWGQIALQSEDKDTAAARWSEMAVLAMPSPAKSKTGSRTPPVPTVAQFNQAADIATLAADNDLLELSQRIVRETLQAGRPVNVIANNSGFGISAMGPRGGARAVPVRVNARQPGQTDSQTNVVEVEGKLLELVQLWNRKNVPPADQYETLAAIVFPEARPAEIFLYSRAIAGNPASAPSVGKLLVTAAIKAGRTDDLTQRIAARENQPLAQPVAQTLRSLLEAEFKPQ